MAKARRTGYHGLPAEYRTPDGEKESWSTVLGYLTALESCRRPIVVAIADERISTRYSQQIGFLRHEGEGRAGPGHLSYQSYGVFWPDRDQLSGSVALYEHLFEGATLYTYDGDDYFGLSLSFGTFRIVFLDSNVNLDRAHPKRERRFEDLPTAEGLEEELAALPVSEAAQQLRLEATRLRVELVELGAEAARTMSDAEIMAAGVRVRWKFSQDESARGKPLSDLDWVPALAQELAEAQQETDSSHGPAEEP